MDADPYRTPCALPGAAVMAHYRRALWRAFAALRLTRRALLILALLLSLGLWAGLWAAIASLASAMLG